MIVKEDVEIAKVTEPGAVFGEPSVLLDQPHTAHVRALEMRRPFSHKTRSLRSTLRRSLHGG